MGTFRIIGFLGIIFLLTAIYFSRNKWSILLAPFVAFGWIVIYYAFKI